MVRLSQSTGLIFCVFLACQNICVAADNENLFKQASEFTRVWMDELQSDELAIRLSGILTTKLRVGVLAKSSSDAFGAPAQFAQSLESQWGFEHSAEQLTGLARLESLFDLHQEQFASSRDCVKDSLQLPTNINEVVSQIESASADVSSRFAQAHSRRGLRRLKRDFDEVLTMLSENPFASELSRAQKSTLRRFMQALDNVDMPAIFCASQQWLLFADERWLNNLRQLLNQHEKADEEIIRIERTPLGSIVFGGRANLTLVAGDILFLADLSGDDVYAVDGTGAFSGIPQLLIDFEGNDTYESSNAAALGAAVGSVSGLIDFEGNDQYLGNSLTMGSAILGLGFLLDFQGLDKYVASNFAQGFSLFGVGLLEDQAGADDYQLKSLGQGLGMTNGIAQLADLAGDDRYSALGGIPTSYGTPGLYDAWAQGVGLGPRGIGPGGVGLLIDAQGSDYYDAGSFAQGGGYFFGVGAFNDLGKENDTYRGTRYNFAWGAHGGIGYFNEAGGDDSYQTRHIVAASLAWDRSLSLFQDHSGNDHYNLGDFSLAAAGLNSMAQFIDYSGYDVYNNVLPADADDSPPNFSLFIDVGTVDNRFWNHTFDRECTQRSAYSFTFVLSVDEIDSNVCETE